MTSYQTPLKEARGKGSAKHGVGHFIAQRVSALALIVLVLWAVYSALRLANLAAQPNGYSDTVAWLQSPFNAVPAALLIGVGVYHMQLGMRTIIEDYIARRFTLSVLLVLNLFACWIIAAVGVLSVLKVALTGAGAY